MNAAPPLYSCERIIGRWAANLIDNFDRKLDDLTQAETHGRTTMAGNRPTPRAASGPGSKDIDADWVTLKCGNYNKVTKTCSGQNYK